MSLPSASASPRRPLGAQGGRLAVEPGLRIAVDTLLLAKGTIARVPAGPEDTSGLDIEADLKDIEFDLEDTGFQNRVPGASAAGAGRPGSASAGVSKRPEGPFDCNVRGWVAGYRLALLLPPWACQPLRSSLVAHMSERVQWWYQPFVI